MPVKSISMPDDIKAYLDGLPNASAYVVGLVRKDREGKGDEIERTVLKVLEGMGIRKAIVRRVESG